MELIEGFLCFEKKYNVSNLGVEWVLEFNYLGNVNE